jgi:hypothetical protein
MHHPGLSDRSTREPLNPAGGPRLLGDVLGRLHDSLPRRGEIRLALAVLEDALDCLETDRRIGRLHPVIVRWEVERWVASRERTTLFAFENVCRILGLEPAIVRERILGWDEHRRRTRAAFHAAGWADFKQDSPPH